MKNVLVVTLILLWLLLGWMYRQDYWGCCQTQDKNSPINLSPLEKEGTLLFKYVNTNPIFRGDGLDSKDSILRIIDDEHKLEITGWHDTNLIPPEDKNLGFSRALETRKLFPELVDEKILFKTREVNCDTLSKTQHFPAVDFTVRKTTTTIKDTAESTLILLPFTNTPLPNSEVESILDGVAKKVKIGVTSLELTDIMNVLNFRGGRLEITPQNGVNTQRYLTLKGINSDIITAKI